MAKKEENALDRLARLSEPSNERDYTLEEQMDSVSTDEFLDGMSLAAKDQMGRLFEEVKTDDDTTEPVNTQPNIDTVTPVTETPMSVSVAEEKPAVAVDVTEEPPESSSNSDELFNNNTEKHKRKYTRRNTSNEETQQPTAEHVKDTTSNPVFDQIAKDLIDELRNRRFKINRFDDKSMAMVYDYMYNKF